MPRGRKHPIGWREWLALPELGITAIKAKIDTGARSSTIHAPGLSTFERQGKPWARFRVYPRQRDSARFVEIEAPVVEFRMVRSSSGQVTQRPVIVTMVEMRDDRWPIELTLVDRAAMGFRMLLGRTAIRDRFLVDPQRSFVQGTLASRLRRTD